MFLKENLNFLFSTTLWGCIFGIEWKLPIHNDSPNWFIKVANQYYSLYKLIKNQ